MVTYILLNAVGHCTPVYLRFNCSVYITLRLLSKRIAVTFNACFYTLKNLTNQKYKVLIRFFWHDRTKKLFQVLKTGGQTKPQALLVLRTYVQYGTVEYSVCTLCGGLKCAGHIQELLGTLITADFDRGTSCQGP
jgi:hypothetical protein